MKNFKDIQELVDDIEQRKNRGYGLQHFKEYMNTINNPHLALKAIHVAGTNGKGSTTNDIRAILQEAGYQVGTFTSPYMITHLDRIRINDNNINEKTFLDIANQYYDSWIAWDLSMFEIDMCIACLYFLQKNVDFCVFEVGLGGRKDSTNILFPLVSLITNIGMDHMELLGDTYEKIAEEKAGIMKQGINVISAEQKKECIEVFKQHSKICNSTYYNIKNITNIHMEEHIVFDYGSYPHIQLCSDAHYQCKNAALAIETIEYLRNKKIVEVSDEHIYKGLHKANWIGRFEVIHTQPTIILDGAHNADGIKALAESLKYIDKPQVIFSVLKDKNFEEMLSILEEVSDNIMVCPFQNERALDVHILKNRPHIQVVEDYREALQNALKEDKTTIITGSLYFISEVRAYWFKNH